MIQRAVAAAIAAAIASISAITLGWVPDWVWPLLPYWPVAAVLVGAGIAWKFAGTPGLVIFSSVVGFILGRKSIVPDEDKSDAPKPPRGVRLPIRKKRRLKGIFTRR